jgi:hypothetical protein
MRLYVGAVHSLSIRCADPSSADGGAGNRTGGSRQSAAAFGGGVNVVVHRGSRLRGRTCGGVGGRKVSARQLHGGRGAW